MPYLDLNPYPGYTSTQGPSQRTGGHTAGGVTGGNLTGAAPFSYSPAYGGIPQVPSPTTTAGAAVAGNIGNLGGIYNLGGGVNQFQSQQLQQALGTAIPNYAGLKGAQSQNIASNLAGQVNQDVINQIIQGAAERGIATGSPGSANANSAYLRALGLTSMGLQQQGQQNLNAMIGATPLPQLMSAQSFLVGPQEQQAAQTAANLYRSAPQPAAAAGAAIGAANAGMRAGGASVPQQRFDYSMPNVGGASYFPSQGLQTMNYGGQTLYQPPAATNWQDYLSNTFGPNASLYGGAPAGSSGAIGSNPMTSEDWNYLFGDEGSSGYIDTSTGE